MSGVFANGPEERDSIPNHNKTQKMVPDATLLNTAL